MDILGLGCIYILAIRDEKCQGNCWVNCRKDVVRLTLALETIRRAHVGAEELHRRRRQSADDRNHEVGAGIGVHQFSNSSP